MSIPPSPSIPSTAASSRTTSPTGSTRQHPAPPSSRRPNRAALRDYYNLKSSPSSAVSPDPQAVTSPTHAPNPSHLSSPQVHTTTTTTPSPLDQPSFSPSDYINNLLATSHLSDVLRAEASLINEIKGLDGERKALVYDNYSKLITATDTIRRMRRDMGSQQEMAGKGMLGPAVGHIAATVASLRERGLREGVKEVKGGVDEGEREERGRRRREREREKETVRWVMGAPKRLGGLIEEGRRGEAEVEWGVVRGLLGKWEGVGGVEAVKGKCERVMERER